MELIIDPPCLLLGARLGRLTLLLNLLLLLLLNGRLLLPHGVVPAPERQKLGVGAALDNLTLVKDHDLVRRGDGGQPVSKSRRVRKGSKAADRIV